MRGIDVVMTESDYLQIIKNHQGTVLRLIDGKDAIVQLQYGLEGNCFVKNLKKEDGSTVAVDETADFKITELDAEKKKIIVSHTRTWQETAEDEAPKKKGAAKKSAGTAGKSFGDKTTLGDLDALSQLKDQMDGKKSEDKQSLI